MEREFCFVIQPFDEGGEYDKLYEDFFEPAIKKNGLEADRADLKKCSIDVITHIKQKIEKAKLCLVEISEDNPNVWYEFGYADGIGKKFLLVCNEDKRKSEDLPFDIKNIKVFFYNKNDKQKNKELEEYIRETLNMLTEIEEEVLLTLNSIAVGTSKKVNAYTIFAEMEEKSRSKSREQISVAIRRLCSKGMIREVDMKNENEDCGYIITQEGIKEICN